MYFSGLDIILALLYLLIIWWEAKQSQLSLIQQILVGFLWQMPAFFLSLGILFGLDQSTDLSYYSIFILQLWHTPMLPFSTLLPVLVLLNKPLYYFELFLMAPLLWSFYLLPRINRTVALQKQKKLNPLV